MSHAPCASHERRDDGASASVPEASAWPPDSPQLGCCSWLPEPTKMGLSDFLGARPHDGLSVFGGGAIRPRWATFNFFPAVPDFGAGFESYSACFWQSL